MNMREFTAEASLYGTTGHLLQLRDFQYSRGFW